MEQNAIKQIEDLAAANLTAQQLGLKEYAAVIVPERFRLESLEKFQDVPNAFRGNFDTTVLAEFIAYINENGSTDTAIYIDACAMFAKAIIDQGNHDLPTWGYHTAHAALEKTPEYAALLAVNEKSLAQQDLIDFAEDWDDFIQFIDSDAQPMDFRKTLASLRKTRVNAQAEAEQTVGNFAGSRSTLEQVEIRAGYEKLPYGFIFSCAPYEGFETRDITCQLRASNGDKGVAFKYRAMKLQALQVDIGDELKDKIRSGIDINNLPIYLGHMKYQQ